MELDERMAQFRLASRELYNHYFHPSQHDDAPYLAEERFSVVAEHLFDALVVEPLDLPYIVYGRTQVNILVVPRQGESMQCMINREIDSGYWDHSQSEFSKDASLHFISFFDWDMLDHKDHRYVRVLVAAWPSHPELVGKHALVESNCVKFQLA